MDWKMIFQMSLAMNCLGVHIEAADGHWWIKCEETYTGYWFSRSLKDHGLTLNSKIYGGPLEAIATVDEAFRQMTGKGLVDGVYTDEWPMGELKPAMNRIGKGTYGLA